MRPSQLFIAVLSSSRDSISDPRSTLSTGPRITQTQSDEVQFSLHMSRVQSYSRTYTCLTIGSLPQIGVLSRRYLKLYVRHTPAKARINFDRQTKKKTNKQTNNTHKTSARNAAEEQSVSGNDLPQKMATVPVESKICIHQSFTRISRRFHCLRTRGTSFILDASRQDRVGTSEWTNPAARLESFSLREIVGEHRQRY